MRAQKLTTSMMIAVLLLGSVQAQAAREDEPQFGDMATDLVVARPVGVALTALGAAAFVVSLPFSALGGNITQAAEKLVLEPGRETFVRCLGCSSVGRYENPDK
ncbi:MAG: hypothetical protein AAF513_01715 [Pseudomonadota bacterium]